MAIEINTSAGNTIEVTQSDGTSVTFSQETSSVSVSSPASTSVQVLEKGVKGDKGDTGDTGPQGETGPGVASGGTENQFIQKNSATDYDTKWSAYTLPAADGADGQVLTTNGAATVTFAYPKTIAEDVKNVSGGTLTKGTPVHVTGSVGNLAEVIAADAATNYPAHFVLNEDLADDAEGLGIALGFINNVDVPDASIYNEGDTVYLGASGGFTTTKPTGASNAIQNLGIIIKVNVTGGGPAGKISGIIMGAGRANDVPNIPEGYVWIGDASGVAQPTPLSSISSSQNFSNTNLTVTGDRTHNLALNDVNFVQSNGGTSVMYLDGNNARVGINTTTPGRPLHISGTGPLVRIGNVEIDADGNFTSKALSSPSMAFKATDDTKITVQEASPGTITFDVLTGTGATETSTEVVRILGTTTADRAYVGIGTTTPSSNLHVVGDVRVEGDLTVNGSYTQIDTDVLTTEQWNVTNDGTGPAVTINQKGAQDIMDVQDDGVSVFYIEDGGNVGIGTTSPSSKLDVSGGVTASGPIDSSDATNTSITSETARFNKYGLVANRSVLHITNENASGDIRFGISGTHGAGTKMTLKSSGNFGIGTLTPSAKLDVVGLANINDGSNNVMISSGNTALTTGTSNTAVGYQAGYSNTTGSNNIAIGRNAGYHATGSNNALVGYYAGHGASGASTFSNAVALGYQALQSLTTGSSNTGLGYRALASNLTGGNNTAVGNIAGVNITGGNNTVMGFAAGQDITSGSNTAIGWRTGEDIGSDNTMVGREAGRFTTSNNNVAIGGYAAKGVEATSTFSNTVAVGYQALTALTTGISNTSVGYQALTNVTTASSNTAVGYNAGFAAISNGSNSFVGAYAGANSTGSSNTAVGYGASYTNTTGDNITAIGRNSLFHNTTGSNNVAIGRDAGEGASGASTFSNTVAVGYQALTALTTGAGNTAVGYLASTNVTSGSSNVSLGYEALNQTQGGNNNIAIGRAALNNNVGGGQNVAIGRTAGYSSLSSGNVFLGYQAGYYETGGNKLYIANSDTTTPLIYGEFDNEILNVNGKLKPNSVTVDDEGLSAAGDYGPGAEIWYQGTSTPLAGSCYYLDSTGGWTAARANAAGTATGMLAVSAGTDSDVDGMVLRGFVQIGHTLTGSVGDAVYVDTTTAGRFTTTKPTGTGNFVRRVGYLAKGTNVIYFNPSPEWEAL